MSESANSNFHAQQLGYFPHLFSDEERDEIAKWGARAAGLTDGTITPASEKEQRFVETAKAMVPPTTRFQRVWLRYLQAVDIQTKWRECERQLATNSNLLSTANLKIEQLEEDVIRLTKWGKTALKQQEQAKVNFTSRIDCLKVRIRVLEDQYLPKENAQPKSNPDNWGGWVDDWREQK